MISSAAQIQDYLLNGKHYEDLTREEKVALSANKMRELADGKNFIYEMSDDDKVASALLNYLLTWNLSKNIKEDKRFDFEFVFIEAVKPLLEEDFELQEYNLKLAANDTDSQDVDFY